MIVYQGRPENCAGRSEVEIRCYDLLDSLGISYRGVDHEAAMTMEDCAAAGNAIDVPICKNLVLCNRQQTAFYLLLMPGDKPFKTKDLSAQIGSSRLSFASEAHLAELLGVTPGSASVLGLQNDKDGRVKLLIDEEVLASPQFGCHPCKNTTSLGFLTSDLTGRILPALGREWQTVSLPRYAKE